MADKTVETRAKVERVLKAVIDSELARAVTPIGRIADGVPFSRGLVFSKTNPFSRGIFFSKTGTEVERPNELEREVAMDPVVLGALAERLTQVRELKDLKGEFRINQDLAKRATERSE
jgi:hypothetical protein